MSLLLDALKKAEEAKRQQAGASPEAAAAARELSLEPVAPQTTAPAGATNPLPELSDHLASVDADLAAVGSAPRQRPVGAAEKVPRPAPTSRPGDAIAEQEAVRNVFAAKRTPPPSRAPLWIVLGLLALAGTGIGGWVWWQMQAAGSGTLAARPAGAPSQAAVPNPASPPAAITPTPQPASTEAVPPPPVATNAATPAAPVAAAPSAAQEQSTPVASTVDRQPPPRNEAETPVRISRGQLRVNPALARAYEQLLADDLTAAGASYEQALRGDPKNVDALVGAAVVAQRQGRLAAAEEFYIRAIEADPKDANAQAGWINLRGQTDPAAAESRLKSLLAGQPESATLNFTLGNLYAGQQRWPEAQLAYFNAHTADPGNPDYLFNLAASLDQMHQGKIAADYYRAALKASEGRRPGFDVEQVKTRLDELMR